MKGIYCIKNKNGIIAIRPTEDLEERKKEFENGTLIAERPGRFCQSKYHTFEILKETENPEMEVWSFLLPDLSRVRYSEEIINALAQNKTKKKRVENAVNWFCETFSPEYSAFLDFTDDEFIVLTVSNSEIPKERYGFKSGKRPVYRVFLN